MGEWIKDQNKGGRRHVWGETRGKQDPTLRDFLVRIKPFPAFKNLKVEKIGSEIHVWREEIPEKGQPYWTSCMRFVDDSWGYWDVWFRPDERRWRTTDINEMPIGKAIQAANDFYLQKFVI